jgi:hypothetical protein
VFSVFTSAALTIAIAMGGASAYGKQSRADVATAMGIGLTSTCDPGDGHQPHRQGPNGTGSLQHCFGTSCGAWMPADGIGATCPNEPLYWIESTLGIPPGIGPQITDRPPRT